MYFTQMESFCLRQLLLNVKGATSFEALQTIDGIMYNTFREACIALDLIESDDMWIACMKDAIALKSALMCRELFVYLLLYCSLSDPFAMYTMFCADLKADYYHTRLHMQNYPVATAEEYSIHDLLWNLEQNLNSEGMHCHDFGLPAPNMELYHDLLQYENLDDYNHEEYYNNHIHLLNESQRSLFDCIYHHLENKQGGLIFCDAPAGTGKTFCINVILASIRRRAQTAFGTAASGIAACLIHKGTTAHFRFKFPIPIYTDSTCSINVSSQQADDLKVAKLLVIDEAPMLHRFNLEALDRFLRELMDNAGVPFGGKLVLLCGDFRQILPIIPRGNRARIVQSSLKNSPLWKFVQIIPLTVNMRIQALINVNPTPENRDKLDNFAKWLLQVGEGRTPIIHGNANMDLLEIPTNMWCDSPLHVIDSIYGDMAGNFGDLGYFKTRSILSTTNEIVNNINSDILSRLPGEQQSMQSIDTVSEDDNPTAYPQEFLNAINMSGLPEHNINLKVNAVIVLLRNLNYNDGHCNGTRYIVKNIHRYFIEVRRLDAVEIEANILIPRIPMSTKENEFPFIMKRLQFPIKLAFAMTFNRSQGQSLHHCGMILPSSVWTHGQIYVGLSRCGNPDNIAIWTNQDEFRALGLGTDGKKYMTNVVYREIFTS